jgi:hypothetical protein
MIQQWQRNTRPRENEAQPPQLNITFPPLAAVDMEDWPMVICAEVWGHDIHRMYVDGGSSSEVLYEHYFAKLRPEVRKRLIPATTPLIGFSGEISWPI